MEHDEQSEPPDPGKNGKAGSAGYWLAESLLGFVVFASVAYAIPRATEVAMSYERSIPQVGGYLYELSVIKRYVHAGVMLAPWLVLIPFHGMRWLRIGYLLVAAGLLIVLLLTIAGGISPP